MADTRICHANKDYRYRSERLCSTDNNFVPPTTAMTNLRKLLC